MSGLRLRLREPLQQRLDLEGVLPAQLAGVSHADIGARRLRLGREAVRLGDLFEISGGDAAAGLTIESDSDRLDGLGAGMDGGELRVSGRAGAYLGRDMRAGRIQVEGDCGIFAASGLRGGEIHIRGNAGDFLGAARPGERRGMRGGLVHVTGNAGDRVGDHQRRGMVVIEGDCGDYCGSRMVAGSILVFGRCGAGVGTAMRRGTLLLARAPRALPATFNDNGRHDLAFLGLLWRDLQSRGLAGAHLPGLDATRVQRWLGDLACGGLGEILVLP